MVDVSLSLWQGQDNRLNIMLIKNILYQSNRKKDARSLHRLRAIKLPVLFEQNAHGSKTQA